MQPVAVTQVFGRAGRRREPARGVVTLDQVFEDGAGFGQDVFAIHHHRGLAQRVDLFGYPDFSVGRQLKHLLV